MKMLKSWGLVAIVTFVAQVVFAQEKTVMVGGAAL